MPSCLSLLPFVAGLMEMPLVGPLATVSFAFTFTQYVWELLVLPKSLSGYK